MRRTALFRFFSGIIFFTFLINWTYAQGKPVDEIDRAMKQGDVGMLVQHFGTSVDITINNSQSTYSPAQAEMVLRKFFSKNGVKTFDLEQTGQSQSNNAVFTIGTLLTSKGNFKVYLYLKPKDNKMVLQQIRIEK